MSLPKSCMSLREKDEERDRTIKQKRNHGLIISRDVYRVSTVQHIANGKVGTATLSNTPLVGEYPAKQASILHSWCARLSVYKLYKTKTSEKLCL